MKLKSKYIFSILLISMLFKPLWIFEIDQIQASDDLSYWLHSATLALDKDLEYLDDYILDHYTIDKVSNAPLHPPGSGFGSAFFVYIFSGLDNLFEIEIIRLNPTKSFAYLGFFASSLFFTYFGFYFINLIIREKRYVVTPVLYWVILLSTLIHFTGTRFLMSHTFEFFLCSALIYYFESEKQSFYRKTFFIVFFYFLLSITRPSTFIYSLFLTGIYFKRSLLDTKKYLFTISNVSLFSLFHIFLANKIYNANFIWSGISKLVESNSNNFISFENFINGFFSIHKLVYSTSMGLIWLMPTIVFLLYHLVSQLVDSETSYLRFTSTFLYIGCAVGVLVLWQGNEVSYGQRFLIGLLPFSCIKMARHSFFSKFRNLIPFAFMQYLSYLYFYSPNLSLTRGETLWGTVTDFAGTNYMVKLIQNLFDLENIFYILLKNIHSINILKFSNLDLSQNFTNILGSEALVKLQNIIALYSSINIWYLIVTNLLIFSFCYAFTKLTFKK